MDNSVSPEALSLIIELSFVTLIIASFAVSVMFILSQQRLARILAKQNGSYKIHGAWLWTQLLPLWSYIALVVVAVKLDDQIKIYQSKHNQTLKFKGVLVYWYVGLTILNLVPLINIATTIISLVLFIIIWSNIAKTTKQLLEKDNLEN
ncbi:hypothetical protein LO80_01075 [Candidatus Francisella endociliophora]|uniref:DUF4328 domain-containing protein n=1 Tax=Candidatus Francisella endociliophora TaxID=653937 RepID=A0A097EMA7_9GAMM|nr:hypothetical protein [Francisella sp. FSC1006]AIT08701.1 hypothetical protein LO80_01075 [Francisella sp. FSC1006]